MSELNIYSKEQTDNLLAGKQSNLTFDTAPVSGSTNPVTSGGIKTAIDTKQDTLVSGTTIKTINGVPILGSGDMSISGSGMTAHRYSTWGAMFTDILSHYNSSTGILNCKLSYKPTYNNGNVDNYPIEIVKLYCNGTYAYVMCGYVDLAHSFIRFAVGHLVSFDSSDGATLGVNTGNAGLLSYASAGTNVDVTYTEENIDYALGTTVNVNEFELWY